MSKSPHVALLIETSRAYGRGCLRGVKRYLLEHERWSIFVERRSLESPVPPWLKNWRGDGIITRTDSRPLLDAVLRTKVPAVELRPTLHNPLPVVRTDDRMVGQLAARHLLSQEHYQFGCVSVGDAQYDHFDLRRDGFIDYLAENGHRCEMHYVAETERSSNWERQQEQLARWLTGLPKPVGVLATTDQSGLWLLDACGRAGVRVPEEVSVVGVENDSLLCSLATPPLSSVQLDTPTIGYRAAELLDRLMRGHSPPSSALLVDPIEVVVRQSSNMTVLDDVDMARALQFIRNAACGPLTVDDVAKHVRMSRSSLERRMRRAISRSPMTEIRRIRLGRARQLLAETDLTLAEIAIRAGFQHPQYLSDVFKRAHKETPGAFRDATQRRRYGGELSSQAIDEMD